MCFDYICCHTVQSLVLPILFVWLYQLHYQHMFFDTKTNSNSECYCTLPCLQWFDALSPHFLFNALFCIVNDSMRFSASSMMQCTFPHRQWFNALFRVVNDSMHSSASSLIQCTLPGINDLLHFRGINDSMQSFMTLYTFAFD